MAKVSVKEIYRQNDILEGLLLSWHSMRRKERREFIKEIQFFLDAVVLSEQRTKSKSAKIQLREMIEFWDEFLNDPDNISIPELDVVATEVKSFSLTTKTRIEHMIPSDFFIKSWPDIAHSVSQPLSSNKIDHDSAITFPLNPKLKEIHDHIYRIIDTKKNDE